MTKSEALKLRWENGTFKGTTGRKMSDTEKEKHSVALRGKMPKNLEMLNANKFGKNNPMWGKTTSDLQKSVMRARVGELHPNWKGDDVGYCGLHDWLKKNEGSANKCENLDCSKDGKKKFAWANITGIYKRERKHWAMLCVTCHNRYDKKKIKLNINNKIYGN